MTYTLIVRSIIIYFLVLGLLRLMGKRQIGEMQPFELVITLIIADLATIPMAETALPLVHGIIPLLTLATLHYFLSLLARKSLFARKLLNGKPVILIGPDGIDYNVLKGLNMNFNDLQEMLRGSGYFNLEEVLYAIMQTNGTVSILPRSAFAPLTAQDIQLPKDPASLPIIILAEGKLVKENIELAKIDEEFVRTELEGAGFLNMKNIALVTLNTQGKMYIQPKQGSFVSRETSYDGGTNW